MYLMHESTIKQENGTFKVTVYVVKTPYASTKNCKEYSYVLKSEHDVDMFYAKYRRKFFGTALNFLKKNNIGGNEWRI